MNLSWKKLKIPVAIVLILSGIQFYYCLPNQLFSDSYSTVLEDKNNQLLSAAIASDGQWRFPEDAIVNEKFKTAIILFEDKRFFNHPGIDPFSFARAIQQNIQASKIISGGSTLSMQVIRMSRKAKARTFFEKIIEILLAVRLELRYTKKEIIALYASHAPFGGNVVGIEAACWRYFGRSSKELSWSEAALLAVLPNNPSLIHLGKNRILLKSKRDRLLNKLSNENYFDQLTLSLAISEPIPENPLALPRLASHLLDRCVKDGRGQQKIVSTIDMALQQQAMQILQDHHQRLKANQVFNAAAIIIEVKTGNVLAYIGNVAAGRENQEQVDIINAPRSTGSILKPFLFAAMLNEGKMTSKTLQPDIPLLINGFAPKNFSNNFDGAVAADQALIRSLNIPAVEELQDYRYEKFYELLKKMGITTLTKPADHYGLSLILGGAEGTLWDITGAYASMARSLTNYFDHPGKDKYNKEDFHSPTYSLINDSTNSVEPTSFLSASSIYLTFDAIKELYRPGEETGWRYFSSTKQIAWKTGTSHGFRDAWAIGVNPDYAIGVWAGNADGEGRPRLTGTEAAAPILFDLFSLMPTQSWFSLPQSELIKIPVCHQSGYRLSDNCEKADTIYVTAQGLESGACPFHKKIHVIKDLKFRVNSQCDDISKMVEQKWFVLPTVQAYYYKKQNSYQPLPPYHKNCESLSGTASMDLIYPKAEAKIFIPKVLTGVPGQTIFEAAHPDPEAIIYWHLDDQFISATAKNHQIRLNPTHGNHVLTLIDNKGELLKRAFSVVSK